MKILNEINRIREIMGINSRLLTEATGTLVRLFRKALTGTAQTTDDVIKALKGSIGKSVIMKELGGMQGLTMRNIRTVDEVSEVIYEILSKHTDELILTEPKMLKEFLESSLGVKNVTDEIVDIVSGKFALDGRNIGLKTFREVLQAGSGVSSFVKGLLSGAGKSTKAKAEFIQEVMGSYGVRNIEDLEKFLRHIGIDDNGVNKIMKHLSNEGADLLPKEFMDMILGKAITKGDYEELAVKVFGESKEFRKFVKNQKIFTQKQIAALLGLSVDDPTLIRIYEALIQDKWIKKGLYYVNKKMSHKWWTIWTKKSDKEIVMNGWKFIFAYIPVVSLWNAYADKNLEREFISAYQKSPAGLSLSDEVYRKVMGNPAYVKDKGGLTNEEANKIASELKYYLTPTFGFNYSKENWIKWCKEFPIDCEKSACWKKNKGNLENIANWDLVDCVDGLSWDGKQFLGTNDGAVEDIYNDDIPTTLASSQVTYFYNKNHADGGDTLEGDLGNMTISLLPSYIIKNTFDLDFRKVDILKILDKKVFAYGIETEADIKQAYKKYGEMLQDYWPRFPRNLKAKECWCTKKVNNKYVPDYSSEPTIENCTDKTRCPGAKKEVWYTRYLGDVPFDMLGVYTYGCVELGYAIYSRGAISNCLKNMDPYAFNALWNGDGSPKEGENDVYSSEYDVNDAETLALDFVEIFGSEESRDALEKQIEELQQKIDEKKK